MANDIARARVALGGGALAALWQWDLALGRVEWDDRLRGLFGYPDTATDPAWREVRIHPADRARVRLSLQRATIASPGAVWSERYRFRKADGAFAYVIERAYVISDAEGPRVVVGAIAPRPGRVS